jgi:hypothetical protein
MQTDGQAAKRTEPGINEDTPNASVNGRGSRLSVTFFHKTFLAGWTVFVQPDGI